VLCALIGCVCAARSDTPGSFTPSELGASAVTAFRAAPPNVGAGMSTRRGGVSQGPWDSLNLGGAVGDEPAAVAQNRARFAASLGATPVFLHQVHGCRVVELGARHEAAQARIETADAAVTQSPGIACTVQVADCLPVLLAAANGRAVGAAHAGWRGLAGGVVEAALQALCGLAHCSPHDVLAWLGPCIGPRCFEVGEDVVRAFAASPARDDAPRFVPHERSDGARRWLADLPQLARDRLAAAGVVQVTGGHWCTFEDRSRFFSFRRDGVCGRMAAAVWLRA
jgi:polyphenol oxidase